MKKESNVCCKTILRLISVSGYQFTLKWTGVAIYQDARRPLGEKQQFLTSLLDMQDNPGIFQLLQEWVMLKTFFFLLLKERLVFRVVLDFLKPSMRKNKRSQATFHPRQRYLRSNIPLPLPSPLTFPDDVRHFPCPAEMKIDLLDKSNSTECKYGFSTFINRW